MRRPLDGNHSHPLFCSLPLFAWEIRFGPQNRFRVYYDGNLERTIVSILAIGSKHGHRVGIGGEEIQL